MEWKESNASPLRGGMVMLKDISQKLPDSERKVAEYILEHPNQAIISTANELGTYSKTSSAAVIRLCKSMGLSGLQELKLRVAGDLQNYIEEEYKEIKANEPLQTVLAKLTSNGIQALKETEEIVNINKLSEAVDKLNKANNIHFFGVGASGIIAQDAQQKFIRINKSAYAFSDLHMVATSVANLNERDVVVCISDSGETSEVLKILEIANKMNATSIAITRYGNSSASMMADIPLYTSASREYIFRSAAMSSRLAQLHLIDVLFMGLVTIHYEESVRHLEITRRTIDELKKQSIEKQ